MNISEEQIKSDIEAVENISVVPLILEVICRTTGMGFAAVARVTEERWVACSVRDEIQFGMIPGGELKIDTTICHEIRQSGKPVIIDHVKEDRYYNTHHTPAMYGFQSYISIPVILSDDSFFGTLCAIDPKPTQLNTPEMIGMLRSYSALIAFYLDSAEKLEATQLKRMEAGINDTLKNHLQEVQSQGLHDARSGEYNVIIRNSTDKINSLLGSFKTAVAV